MNDSDFFLELYKAFPTLFKLVKIHGRTILKIVSTEFIKNFDKIKEYLNGKKLENSIPLLNASETQKYLELIEINQSPEHELVKKYLSPDDWALYMLGQKAKREKKLLNQGEVLEIKKQAINLRGQRGVRFINFIIQDYFDELFIPLLKYQKKELKEDSQVMNWFMNFVNQMIQFFPMAIWVKNETSSYMITRELYKRCVSYNFKQVNIHTINKENIKKINRVLQTLSQDKDFPTFDFDMTYDVKGFDAVTFHLKLKNKK